MTVLERARSAYSDHEICDAMALTLACPTCGPDQVIEYFYPFLFAPTAKDRLRANDLLYHWVGRLACPRCDSRLIEAGDGGTSLRADLGDGGQAE